MPLRKEFPEAGSDYLGGECDGNIYRTVFAGSTLAQTYEMVRQFLIEEGYKETPIPKDAAELKRFRLHTRNKQILLFEDNGYIHNPIKILFPTDRRKKKILTLEIYNEEAPNHLLRFHNLLEEE